MSLLQTLTEIKQLNDLLTPGPVGGQARWEALQQWLASHPTFKNAVNGCLERTPADALNYLASQVGIDLNALRLLDSNGVIEAKAVAAMTELQTLYKERSQQ